MIIYMYHKSVHIYQCMVRHCNKGYCGRHGNVPSNQSYMHKPNVWKCTKEIWWVFVAQFLFADILDLIHMTKYKEYVTEVCNKTFDFQLYLSINSISNPLLTFSWRQCTCGTCPSCKSNLHMKHWSRLMKSQTPPWQWGQPAKET